MLKNLFAVLSVLLMSVSALAAQVGSPAPNFQGIDSNGHPQTLAQYRGKLVVLEWHNQGCPYVKKHYGSGNMQRLQKQWKEKGVVWLTIISSAVGHEGYVTANQENAYLKEKSATPTAAILDAKGTIGRLYGAKTTPHMFVINAKGILVYNGAIDDKESTEMADAAGARNYVSEALNELLAGKPVKIATTRPYGCGVKY
jgi:peroxiredoxin